MLYGILNLLCGLVVVSPSLLQKNKKFFDRFTTYQGWFGVLLFAWGIWGVVSSLLNMGFMSYAPVYWILWLVGGIVMALLGFILGFGLITSYVPSQKKNAEKALKKILPFQKWIGIAAIVIGALEIVFYVMI